MDIWFETSRLQHITRELNCKRGTSLFQILVGYRVEEIVQLLYLCCCLLVLAQNRNNCQLQESACRSLYWLREQRRMYKDSMPQLNYVNPYINNTEVVSCRQLCTWGVCQHPKIASSMPLPWYWSTRDWKQVCLLHCSLCLSIYISMPLSFSQLCGVL